MAMEAQQRDDHAHMEVCIQSLGYSQIIQSLASGKRTKFAIKNHLFEYGNQLKKGVCSIAMLNHQRVDHFSIETHGDLGIPHVYWLKWGFKAAQIGMLPTKS